MAKTAAQTEKKPKKPVEFQRKSRFEGPNSRLEVYARQQGEKFVVFALHRKGGADKKSRGMVSEHSSQAEANAKFDELAAQCLERGWQETVTWMKSAFTAVPPAE